MSLVISFHNGQEPVTVTTVAELDAELDRIRVESVASPQAPLLAALTVAGTQRTMLVGQRGAVGVLNYVDLASTEGGFVSKSGTTGQLTPPYVYFGSWTGFDADAEIPVEQVRTAARELLSTGARPVCIEWH
jgi:hypothetical protein